MSFERSQYGLPKLRQRVPRDRIAEIVPIVHTIRVCRDARDDKFLELAVNGEASFIITSDADLLELNPFQDIPIITPASYLGR